MKVKSIMIIKNINIILIINIIIIIKILSNFFNIYFITAFKNTISNIILENKYLKIENYLKICKNSSRLKITKNYKKRINPKISIISSIFNSEKYLLRFLNSIYFQNYNNIEIILIDDYSTDNSVKFIEEYQKKDRRIILIKNKKNKGTFINRNLGGLYSKGKYIILPDPDDILSKNNLKILFDFAKKYNYDLLRFNLYLKDEKIAFKKIVDNLDNKPVFQPELSTYIYYGNNELQIIDCYVHNKFIKRDIYIKVINALNSFYTNIYMTFMEDSIINYLLYRNSKSYYFVKIIGYYYIKNTQSITKNLFKISDLRIKFIFIYLKFIFEYSKNNKIERDMNNILFTNIVKRFNILRKSSSSVYKKYYRLYKEVINEYTNNKYIYIGIKKFLREFINLIEKE